MDEADANASAHRDAHVVEPHTDDTICPLCGDDLLGRQMDYPVRQILGLLLATAWMDGVDAGARLGDDAHRLTDRQVQRYLERAQDALEHGWQSRSRLRPLEP